MIKIAALNDETGEDSDSEEEVSKEALEQIALQQYAKALDLQRRGNLVDATQLLKDLLDTELLYDVKKPAPGEKVAGPLFNLKYLCYKNLGSMLNSAGNVEGAIEAYSAASELDDTDITLWHRLGLVCMQAKHFEMALYAFQKGVDRNPRHWPCIDKIVTLLLALDYNEQCIATIHEALKLDPGYLRGLAYRRHIYTVYKHMREYMEHLNPVYKWNENDDGPIDEEMAKVLIKEAQIINELIVQQQQAERFIYMVPNVKLKKPISRLTWESVGESLIHMHHYMTEHGFSHACFLEIVFLQESPPKEMEVCEEQKENEQVENKLEENVEQDKINESASEVENNEVSDKDLPGTDLEKFEGDVENPLDNGTEGANEVKTRKNPVRRRGSALSFLQQWEWCNKRRSGRKKVKDNNIYDILRGMVPLALVTDCNQGKENQVKETSPNIPDLNKLFDENEKDEMPLDNEYFGTEMEQNDVKEFITKYTENRKDIIDLLNVYLNTLACKWRFKWPDGLSKVFVEANKCYSTHIDTPTFANDNKDELLHYTTVNLLVEELLVNDKLKEGPAAENVSHQLNVVDSIEIILVVNPHVFPGVECLELIIRMLWLKVHIHILNKCEDFALDCLYQIEHEFNAMGEHHETYGLNIVNFSFKPLVNKHEIEEYIKFLERNKKLSTVKDLYDKGCYEEVLSIIIDSFEHCKTIARDQEEEMSLDFAVQLSLILDSYWALEKVHSCLKWSFTCLDEALKHYFRYTSGTPEYDKWTLTAIKILCCIEHILSKEPLSCLDALSTQELGQGLENLIRIIGHQVETNANEMPIDTVDPWIIMHYILQREEDQGRGRTTADKVACDDIPNPLMLLFLGHENLGAREWCCKSEGKLLYFILDTVVPRLRSPSLSKSLEQICQHLEQCVYCLFGHPGKKNRIKYLLDHNVTPHDLDWKRAQQIYEIFRPPILPALEGKISAITADTELLFYRILALLPPELDPQKYLPELEKYIKGTEEKLPSVPPLLPYKMKDIYFLLGDHHFKKEDRKLSIKYNMLDVIVNNDRLESWAQISLAKAFNLERILNSCKNINNEKEYLNPAKATIICFKRALQLDPTYMNILIEYGNFVYSVHSFCSRLLKQASESLSMEEFEALEMQKEDLLNSTNKCFTTVLKDLTSGGIDKSNEDSWLIYYMLGKVAEKKNKPPSVYLNYYMQGVKSLQESGATYPSKINYSSPTRLCIEVLELHYRIHASILKYIEQHENKPIPSSVGKVFLSCIEEWQKGPFSKNKNLLCKKDRGTENETDMNVDDSCSVQAANILKRSISDAGEEDTHETKRLKLESAAAKVRRSASYDAERVVINNKDTEKDIEKQKSDQSSVIPAETKSNDIPVTEKSLEKEVKKVEELNKDTVTTEAQPDETDKPADQRPEDQENKEEETSSSSSSSSSSESSSSESSSDSSCDSGRGSDCSSKSSQNSESLTDEEIMKIVGACLDALEDCASRFPPHCKSIYRLAHYHFYYKNGKDIERCRDLMLSTFTSRSGQKLGGLFSERKQSNFFNNIWKIPHNEVERGGGFLFHINRSVLLTMEILKEIDDHKTLLDLSLQLQRIPDLDKKYLRDSDREELAQQAFSLCVQSLKGQLMKFNQQADIKSNDVEQEALKSLMLDIYRAYMKVQKQPNSKQLVTLLVDAYKLVTTTPITENMNLVDLSMKFCQSKIQSLKQQATIASQNAQKKQSSKSVEISKTVVPTAPQTKIDKVQASTSSTVSKVPSVTQVPSEPVDFQNFPPILNDSLLSQQAAAALSLSYLSNISALAGYTSLQNTLQSSIQSSFQSEFYRQFMGQNFPYMPPHKKQKRGPKPGSSRSVVSGTQVKPSKHLKGSIPNIGKPVAPSVRSLQKSTSAPLTPSMGTVLPTLPASLTANLTSYTSNSITSTHNTVPQAHMTTISSSSASMHPKPPMPHQQASPGKTLQEKLAERQKTVPSVSKNTQDINASIGRLPSSLIITKTSSKQTSQGKKTEVKKSLSFGNEVRPKPIASGEIIVLDDDDD